MSLGPGRAAATRSGCWGTGGSGLDAEDVSSARYGLPLVLCTRLVSAGERTKSLVQHLRRCCWFPVRGLSPVCRSAFVVLAAGGSA